MSAPLPRRGFLQGLVRLPLIGGGVTLIGAPKATAEPVTIEMLATYADWLFYERRILISELCSHDPQQTKWAERWVGNLSDEFHFPRGSKWPDVPLPSSRAALVMSAVGCDWRANADSPRLWRDRRETGDHPLFGGEARRSTRT